MRRIWQNIFSAGLVLSCGLPGFFAYGALEPSAADTQIRQSVWRVASPAEGKFLGTGFFISRTRVITAFHVVEEALKKGSQIVLRREDHSIRMKIKRAAALSAVLDLALLETEGEAPSFLPLRPAPPAAAEGQNFSVYGYPVYPRGDLLRMRQMGRLLLAENMFFPVNKIYLGGSSGSPVVDGQGRAAGVVFVASDNMIGALGLELLRDFIGGERGAICAGDDTEKCLSEAETLLRRQADSGQPRAQYALGYRHFYGMGAEKSAKIAFGWWERAAGQGYLMAQYELSLSLLESLDTVQTGTGFLLRAAARGFAPAEFELGYLYHRGLMVERDDELAARFMLRAARNGSALAAGLMGGFYLDGLGVEKDIEKGDYWLDRSAELDMLDFHSQKNHE